jgi:hypothetical protein
MNNYPKWEEGPSDATHWCAEGEDFYESWYKLDRNGSWSCISCDAWTAFKSSWYGLGQTNPRHGETMVMRGDEQ